MMKKKTSDEKRETVHQKDIKGLRMMCDKEK